MSIRTHYIGDDCEGGHYHDARIAALERVNAKLLAALEEM